MQKVGNNARSKTDRKFVGLKRMVTPKWNSLSSFLPQWHTTIHDLNYTLPCDEMEHLLSPPLCLCLQEEDPTDIKV